MNSILYTASKMSRHFIGDFIFHILQIQYLTDVTFLPSLHYASSLNLTHSALQQSLDNTQQDFQKSRECNEQQITGKHDFLSLFYSFISWYRQLTQMIVRMLNIILTTRVRLLLEEGGREGRKGKERKCIACYITS